MPQPRMVLDGDYAHICLLARAKPRSRSGSLVELREVNGSGVCETPTQVREGT